MSGAGRMPLSVLIVLMPVVAGLGVIGMTFAGGEFHPALAFGLVGIAIAGGVAAIVLRIRRRARPWWILHPVLLFGFGLPGIVGANLSIERHDARVKREADPELNPSLRPAAADMPTKVAEVPPQGVGDPTPPPVFTPSDHVDADCYGDGFVCAKRRVGDAEKLASAVKDVVMRNGGWCFDVMYVGGGRGEKDAISLTLCNHTAAEFRAVGERVIAHLQQANRKLLRNVDLLQVTGGNGEAVEIAVPSR